jgi:uncharacterized protein YjbI with pentapeptide repeats
MKKIHLIILAVGIFIAFFVLTQTKFFRLQIFLFTKKCRICNLSQVNLASKILVKSDLAESDLTRINLSDADLQGSYLFESDLRQGNLEKVNLEGSNLSNANLKGANLEGANLSNANLKGANLEGANLSNANLKGANLEGTDFSNASLTNADLTGSKIFSSPDFSEGVDLDIPEATNFSGANLVDAKLPRSFLVSLPILDQETILTDGRKYMPSVFVANSLCNGTPLREGKNYVEGSTNLAVFDRGLLNPPGEWVAKIGNEASIAVCFDKESSRDEFLRSCSYQSFNVIGRDFVLHMYRKVKSLVIYDVESGDILSRKQVIDNGKLEGGCPSSHVFSDTGDYEDDSIPELKIDLASEDEVLSWVAQYMN